MITIYAESPFLLQIAWQQEQAAECDTIATLAQQGKLELAVPIVALVEPLYAAQGRASRRQEMSNAWRAEGRELGRTTSPTYVAASGAIHEAVLKASDVAQEERQRIDDTIARLAAIPHAYMIPFRAQLFAVATALEAKGSTSIDALAIATILDDATNRAAGRTRAFLTIDKQAVTEVVRADLTAAGVKVLAKAEHVVAWLRSQGVSA